MKLKNLELVVRNTSIQYDGREKLIDNFLEESTKKTHSSPDSFEELLFKYFSLFQDEKRKINNNPIRFKKENHRYRPCIS